MSKISRRELLAGLAGLAIASGPQARAANARHSKHDLGKEEAAGESGSAEPEPEQGEIQYLFFNREEAQFIGSGRPINSHRRASRCDRSVGSQLSG